jgi:hypothetical protein
MELLNTISEKDKQIVLKQVVDMLNRVPNANIISALRGQRQFNAKALAQAASIFDETIRSVCDQWIDSGKSGSSQLVDTPLDRDVNAIPPGYQRPLFDVLAEWLGRNMVPLALQRSGKLAVIYPTVSLAKINDSPSLVGRDFAIGWFKRLLDFPDRYRFARCANPRCEKYFVYGRMPKGSIKNGTYCKKCKGYASVQRTLSTRGRRTKELVGYAADVWEKWDPNSGNPSHKNWVAEQVNKHLRISEISKGRRWVTTHQQKIEAELKRRKYATRKNQRS